jgi:hypothetical protein
MSPTFVALWRGRRTSLDMTNVAQFRVRWTVPLLAAVLGICCKSSAQFTPGILVNDSYWSDGKAEFDIYDGELMRGGEWRHCEVLHIFRRERLDPKTLARVDDPKRGDGINAVRMQQIWTAPIGLFVEQASLTALWRLDSRSLAELNFIATDSLGNVAKRLELRTGGDTPMWNLVSDTHGSGTTIISPSNAFFADELPLRVRTIDFTKKPAEFEMQLADSLTANSETLTFKPAKVSWKPAEKSIEIVVQQGNSANHFVLDRDFPFLLREWTMPDGSKLKMKRGLKADYWNYSKNGDRERALKNAMLQHPD